MEMPSWGQKPRRSGLSARLRPVPGIRSALSLALLGAALVLPATALPSSDHLQTAIQLINQGDLDGGEKEARLALNSPEERAPAWGILGTIRVQQKKYDESVEFLRKAIDLNPRLVGARVTLGGVYILQGKKDPARQMFAEALRLDPDNVNARFNLAQMESDAGEFQTSMEAAQPIASELRRAPEGLVLLATNYSGLQRKDALTGLVADWNALGEAPPELTAAFASALIRGDLGSQALEILEKAREANPRSSGLAFALGRGYVLTHDLEKAERNFQSALTLNPACLACDQEIGRIAEQQGLSEKALAYLVRAKKLAPEDPEVLFDFGRVCLERSLLDDAFPALQKAAALRPDMDKYVYYLGSAYVALHKLTDAASIFGQLLQKHPDDPGLNYATGVVYFLQGKYAEAEASLKRSIQEQPEQVVAYYYLGQTYFTQGQDDQAVTVLQDLVKRHPEHSPTRTLLGTIWVREHKYEEARPELERAISLDPNSIQAHQQLGMLLRRTGKPAESDQELALAKKLETERRSKVDVRLRLLLPD